MKRLFISLAAILCVAATASAQTLIVVEEKPVLTNKKGAPILPQAGDMSIGISTTPFFTYLGNMFTRDGSNSAPTFSSLGAGLNMKFFTADNQAIRAGLTVNFGTDYYYGNPTSNTAAGATVTDRMEKSNQGFGINVGYEWRRGYGRLQGFYGAQLTASYNNVTTHYKYGNEMSATYPDPWTWNFNTDSQAQVSERTIDVKGSPGHQRGRIRFRGRGVFLRTQDVRGRRTRTRHRLCQSGRERVQDAVFRYGQQQCEGEHCEASRLHDAYQRFQRTYCGDGQHLPVVLLLTARSESLIYPVCVSV